MITRSGSPENRSSRIASLDKKHTAVGNSSFIGIVDNLSTLLRLLRPDDEGYTAAFHRTALYLDAYLTLLENGSSDFVKNEMRSKRGHFPEELPVEGHPEPHHEYIARIYRRVSGTDLESS